MTILIILLAYPLAGLLLSLVTAVLLAALVGVYAALANKELQESTYSVITGMSLATGYLAALVLLVVLW